MEPLHKTRTSVEGKAVDFLFLEDADFRSVIQSNPTSFVNDNKEADTALVLVGYPSLTSVVPEGVNFPVSMLESLYPSRG